jgi:ubiquinone/menaquinone biosynthesis C-methylase UbiE
MGFRKSVNRHLGHPRGIFGRIVMYVISKQNKVLYDTVLKEIGNGMDVLDIGFGNGSMLKLGLKRTDSRFFGMDISKDMVGLVAKKNRRYVKDGRLRVENASVDEIPFDTGFDMIYTINTIYFWNDIRKGFGDIYSKLKDNGVFLNLCYTKEWLENSSFTDTHKKYTEREMTDILRDIGFDVEITDIIRNVSYCVKAVKRTGTGKDF